METSVFARYFYICTDVAWFVFNFLGIKHSFLRVDMIFSLVIFEDLQSLLFCSKDVKPQTRSLFLSDFYLLHFTGHVTVTWGLFHKTSLPNKPGLFQLV